ncbi:BAG family molecular chaperone regulator 2-like [Daphnia pulex]|uniref:BAG family molecular chaperone regulator 2-like n=1 Tax=Daphnia pulex TaxID=6669 RepID=UPI001EDDFB96|nr:BAG family molecular chaperone regulator 2-like [Daphnia pulex]
MSSVDEPMNLTITECESALSCESSERSPVASPEHRNSYFKGLARMVRNFKARALLLEDDQESLFTALMNLRDECTTPSPSIAGLGEEAVTVIDDLTHTLMDVNLKVTTKRSNHEEEALHQVNRLIDHLVSKVHEGPNTKELCHVYIRSCYKSGQCTEETSADDDEHSFQSIIINCSPDDKHRIRKRLHGLLNYIDSRLTDIYCPTLDARNK